MSASTQSTGENNLSRLKENPRQWSCNAKARSVSRQTNLATTQEGIKPHPETDPC